MHLWTINFTFFNGAKDRLESSLFSPPSSLANVQSVKDKISQLPRVIRELNLSLDVYKIFSAVNLRAQANGELKFASVR